MSNLYTHYVDRYCVCGCRVTGDTGGYSCPRCYRRYNTKGKLIGNDSIIQLYEYAKAKDITTMQYDNDKEGAE